MSTHYRASEKDPGNTSIKQACEKHHSRRVAAFLSEI
jgi:hypothetical protein